uniref:Zf_CCCH_5 domain-containing protein n=1 Tax=Angiostrongylus cantonensis TaxID=6313 RepID=A0A0K0D1X1_ANGCA
FTRSGASAGVYPPEAGDVQRVPKYTGELPEPPAHVICTSFSYLNEFRVEACPLFKQHQCQQHRPYTCFNWHFANQRRRSPNFPLKA